MVGIPIITWNTVRLPDMVLYAPVDPPGVDLGRAAVQQTVIVHLQNLDEGTTYHYRFVAVQDGELFPQEDRSFSTQSVGGASGLIDGRGVGIGLSAG